MFCFFVLIRLANVAIRAARAYISIILLEAVGALYNFGLIYNLI